MGSVTRLICCAALSAFSLVFNACSSPRQLVDEGQSGPVVLTVGYPHFTGANPLHGMQAAARLISFEGLVSLGRDGRPQPRLAASWSLSMDGLAWTIRLRNNAVFHDGSTVDSAAVRQSLERSLGNVDRDLSPGLSDIVKIESPSSDTLVLLLRDRSTFALDDLTVAIAKPAKDGQQVGTGPFYVTSSTSSQVTMTAVQRYYRGKPQIDQIVWKAYPTVRTAWAAMMRGEIDFLYEVPPEAVEFIEAEDSVKLFSFLRNYAYLVVFNSKRKPFDEPQVRRALNYSINRDKLITRALNNRGQVASGPLWPLHWAYDPSMPRYAYDPGRATALLDASHIPEVLHTEGANNAPGRFHFTCLVPENFALWERMALIVQRDLAEIGVTMNIESVPFEVFNQRISKGDFDAVTIELIVGNTASRPFTFWSSLSTRNVWGYRNEEFDSALRDIRRAADDTMYKAAFRRVQEQGLVDPPAIFLALGEITRAVNKRFEVVAPPNTDILPSIPDWRLAQPSGRVTN
jgi:peptide/nickel transport system substrate-binding protein